MKIRWRFWSRRRADVPEASNKQTAADALPRVMIESLDSVALFCARTVAALAVLGGVVGWWGWKASMRSGKLKDDEANRLNLAHEVAISAAKTEGEIARKETAQLSVQAAKFEKEATEAQLEIERLKTAQTPRHWLLIKGGFEPLVTGKPTGTATIWFLPEDDEASTCAIILWGMLSEAGWKAERPTPIPADVVPAKTNVTLFTRASGGLSGGIVLKSSDSAEVLDTATPLGTLYGALEKVGLGASWGGDDKRAKDDVLILIGAK